jgi:hypothetical protein
MECRNAKNPFVLVWPFSRQAINAARGNEFRLDAEVGATCAAKLLGANYANEASMKGERALQTLVGWPNSTAAVRWIPKPGQPDRLADLRT